VNPIFVAILALNTAVALSCLLAILRVSIGKASFDSGSAVFWNFVLLAACSGFAAWAYPQAFA
jgi:hypothetical protein